MKNFNQAIFSFGWILPRCACGWCVCDDLDSTCTFGRAIEHSKWIHLQFLWKTGLSFCLPFINYIYIYGVCFDLFFLNSSNLWQCCLFVIYLHTFLLLSFIDLIRCCIPQATESARLLAVAERESKQLKDDVSQMFVYLCTTFTLTNYPHPWPCLVLSPFTLTGRGLVGGSSQTEQLKWNSFPSQLLWIFFITITKITIKGR